MAEEIWADEALRSGREDTLGRRPYAQRAAELIDSTHSFDSSIVFGLSGAWGSGKTSLVTMIVEALRSRDSGWVVARFTPWATSDIAGLLSEFYASLIEVLPKNKKRQVRRALAATALVAAPAAQLIPVAGGVAEQGVKRLGEALAKSPSWEVAFTRASNELKQLKQPILMVVDDIDRLHADELMALLKVVRLLGRFNGVQYLLAYDDDTLHRTLAAASAASPDEGSAERFMEKIVQYPLIVPPLLRHQQIARLNAGLASVPRTAVDGDTSDHRLGELIECFTELLRTPRAIDRYIAQLRYHIPLVPSDEIDDADVKLLTLVRVSFPGLFNALPNYRRQLTSGHTGELKVEARSMEYEPFSIEPLLNAVSEDRRQVARALLVALFPKLRHEGQIGVHGSRRRQSVQDEEYFDRYFAMTIPDHDISDAAVLRAIAAAATGDGNLLTELLLKRPAEVRGLVMSKCIDPASQPESDDGRLELAMVAAGIAPRLPSEDNTPFSDQDQLLAWIAELLASLDKSASPEAVQSVITRLDVPGLRVRAWSRLESKMDYVTSSERPAWIDPVKRWLVAQSLASLIAHLKQGDAAPTSAGVGYQIHFVLRNDAAQLSSSIADLVATGQVGLSALASRLVNAQTVVGIAPDWKLSSEFDQETFNLIAPPGDDPWYHEPRQTVDVRDLSWANRRRFATGRVKPPIAPPSP